MSNPMSAPKEILLVEDEDFFRVVRAGFANKRKQLWRNLSTLKMDANLSDDEIKKVLISVVGNEKIRAEELNILQWKQIVKMFFTKG